LEGSDEKHLMVLCTAVPSNLLEALQQYNKLSGGKLSILLTISEAAGLISSF
jgi:hypothetical protein